MEDLEKQLVCPVCLEVFSKPVVILPCQHNLCRKCATDVFQSRAAGVSGGSGGSGGRFRCPSCRHEVVLDRHGVYGLQRNLLVENIIDIYRQQHRSVNGLPAGSAPHQLMCEAHPDERINIYCERCQTPTCSLCKVFGRHRACDVAPLHDIYLQKKSELSDGIAGLVAVNDHIQTLISQMEDTCRTVEDRGRHQRELLCRSVDGLVHILEQRKQELVSAVSEERDERLRHVRALLRAHGQRLETAAALVDSAITSMDHAHMATFIRAAQDILQKMAESSRGPELQKLEFGFENMSSFSIDVEEVSERLRNIHFCPESVDLDDEDDEDETE